ncbi:hypothetical protein ACJX0J_028771, partial [Zea mays]
CNIVLFHLHVFFLLNTIYSDGSVHFEGQRFESDEGTWYNLLPNIMTKEPKCEMGEAAENCYKTFNIARNYLIKEDECNIVLFHLHVFFLLNTIYSDGSVHFEGQRFESDEGTWYNLLPNIMTKEPKCEMGEAAENCYKTFNEQASF